MGSYCPEGTQDPQQCPLGTFSNKTELSDISQCEPCTEGFYCGGNGLIEPSGECSPGM